MGATLVPHPDYCARLALSPAGQCCARPLHLARCPITRLHGKREPGKVQVWAFGGVGDNLKTP